MADSKKPSIPAWQQGDANTDGASDTMTEPDSITLEHARRFLDDESVKAAPPEEKRAFLKGKGLDDTQITQLLDEPRQDDQSTAPPTTAESSATLEDVNHEADARPDSNETSSASAGSSQAVTKATPGSSAPAASFATDSPAPIITYPEFLTKPQRPPPLITPSRLANILAISGGVWALLYSLSGLVVRPMVDNLNEARSEYYEHVNGKLSELVEKLEGVVSEVPYKNGKPLKSHDRAVDDNESITSDPTELFHRDVGTQTSPPPSIVGTTSNTNSGSNNEKPVDVQVARLSAISASLRELTLIHTQKAESNADLRSAIGGIRDQVDKLTYPPVQDFTFAGIGYGQSAEPDDEFKKTKDAIRSVKGIFLSSRSFPAVATR